MKKILLSAILGLAIVVSCEKKQEENAEQVTTEQTATDDHADHAEDATEDEHDASVKLELNNGAKWTMNAEMKPYINDMESQVNAFKPESDDYKVLAKNLGETNDNLIKSCTIKGTPHDVLHAWLMPHMELIDKLKKADNKEDANHVVGDLKHSMESYHMYFD